MLYELRLTPRRDADEARVVKCLSPSGRTTPPNHDTGIVTDAR